MIIYRLNGVVEELYRAYLWVAVAVEETVKLYSWNGIFYEPVYSPLFKGMVKRIFNLCDWQDFKTIYGNEIMTQIAEQAVIDTRERCIYLNNYEYLISFHNGTYDWRNKRFNPPNEKIYFTYALDVDYSPNLECPMFVQFMEQILPDPLFRTRVLVYLGYCLTTSISKKIADIWTGAGRNGKTVLTNIMTMILGLNNVCHISLDELLSKNRFTKIRLKDKQLNLGSEITYDEVDPAGIKVFKEIVTNRFLAGEKKGKDGEEWINITKNIFDVNELPLPKLLMDFAFYRRIHVIPFKVIIREDQIIDDLDVKIFAQEGPQIAMYLISFLDQIDQVLVETPEESERLWFENTLSVVCFVSMCCEIDLGKFTAKSLLYFKYSEWCRDEAKRAVSLNQFTRLLEKTCNVSTIKSAFVSGFALECNYEKLINPQDYPDESQMEPKTEPKYITDAILHRNIRTIIGNTKQNSSNQEE